MSEGSAFILTNMLQSVVQSGTAKALSDLGMEVAAKTGTVGDQTGNRDVWLAAYTARGLEKLGYQVFAGVHQGGTVSFRGKGDCQTLCDGLPGIALRAGLHCAPLAHRSAGTLETGTVRVSFGWNSTEADARRFMKEIKDIRYGVSKTSWT